VHACSTASLYILFENLFLGSLLRIRIDTFVDAAIASGTKSVCSSLAVVTGKGQSIVVGVKCGCAASVVNFISIL